MTLQKSEIFFQEEIYFQSKKTHLEVTDMDTANVKQIGWIFKERKDL